jgi:hypothetical protein
MYILRCPSRDWERRILAKQYPGAAEMVVQPALHQGRDYEEHSCGSVIPNTKSIKRDLKLGSVDKQ